jgi:hypothetical protein
MEANLTILALKTYDRGPTQQNQESFSDQACALFLDAARPDAKCSKAQSALHGETSDGTVTVRPSGGCCASGNIV